jgi:hypothetical protein
MEVIGRVRQTFPPSPVEAGAKFLMQQRWDVLDGSNLMGHHRCADCIRENKHALFGIFVCSASASVYLRTAKDTGL